MDHLLLIRHVPFPHPWQLHQRYRCLFRDDVRILHHRLKYLRRCGTSPTRHSLLAVTHPMGRRFRNRLLHHRHSTLVSGGKRQGVRSGGHRTYQSEDAPKTLHDRKVDLEHLPAADHMLRTRFLDSRLGLV